MILELGGIYRSRDGLYEARIISLIGKWWESHPCVAELYDISGKKKERSEGIFTAYEHFTKEGRYLGVPDSNLDLVTCIKEGLKDGKRSAGKRGTKKSQGELF